MNSPVHGEYKNLSFVFVDQIFCELWVLMDDVVEIKLIAVVFKPCFLST